MFFLLLLLHTHASCQSIPPWGLNQPGAPIAVLLDGQVGVSPVTANQPGSRNGHCAAFCGDHKMYMFGGQVFNATATGFLSDLWSFDTQTQLWTLVGNPGAGVQNVDGVGTLGGSSSTSNYPGSRHGSVCACVGTTFYMFGGAGRWPAGHGQFTELNDFWLCNITNGAWQWAQGDPAVPGTGIQPPSQSYPWSATGAGMVSDGSNTLYLFGGFSATTAPFNNDLFSYDIPAATWQFVTGFYDVHTSAIYSGLESDTGRFDQVGADTCFSSTNSPGFRINFGMTYDPVNQYIWVFGGIGIDSQMATQSFLGDLWAYDPVVTQSWCWYAGQNTAVAKTDMVSGTKGQYDPSYQPYGRDGTQMVWNNGILYIFGGYVDAVPERTNDLWGFNIATGAWGWLAGELTTTAPFSLANVPAQAHNVSFEYGPNALAFYSWVNDLASNKTNTTYLFGGEGAAFGYVRYAFCFCYDFSILSSALWLIDLDGAACPSCSSPCTGCWRFSDFYQCNCTVAAA